jgi:YbbR domain-containing protein
MGFVGATFTANWSLKLVSMLCALTLVALQRGEQDIQQRTVPVGLVLRLPPDDVERELMTVMPANIHVTVRGTARAIDAQLQAGISPIELDLRGGRRERILFEQKMFEFSSRLEVTIIDPAALDLEWDDLTTRDIPIQASITGNVAAGYEKGEVVVEPKAIPVRGPSRLVEVLQFVRLAAFDVSGKTDGLYRHQIAIDPPPQRVEYLGPASATVSVAIRRRVVRQKFDALEVEVVGTGGARTKPGTVDVTVTGPPEVIAGLRESLVVPRVDLDPKLVEAQAHGSVVLPVIVDLAKAEAEIQPPKVKVTW